MPSLPQTPSLDGRSSIEIADSNSAVFSTCNLYFYREIGRRYGHLYFDSPDLLLSILIVTLFLTIVQYNTTTLA